MDDIFHGPPGVEYEKPTQAELDRGAVIVRQVPSVVLIEESPELLTLFIAEMFATEYRNEKARELQDVTLPWGELIAEMRSIDYRAGPEEKAAYEAARQDVRDERTRLMGRNGVKYILVAEKRAAEKAMQVALRERMELQRAVRIALRQKRMVRRSRGRRGR